MTRDLHLLTTLKTIFTDSRVNRCYCCDSARQFGIVEQNNKACIIHQEDAKTTPCFLIINTLPEPVHFLAIDGCFFSKPDVYLGKRNDCIVFNQADFCFIELKLNVKSKKQRGERINEAIEQLGDAISYFKNNFQQARQDFMALGFSYEAYIVFHSRIYPKTSAQSTQRAIQFLQQHGVKLYERNTKEFTEKPGKAIISGE